MAVYTSHAEGSFCWLEIRTTERVASQSFYGGLFGWKFEDIRLPSGETVYTLASLEGRCAAGMCEPAPAQRAAGMPAFWNPFLLVADVGNALSAAKEQGAKPLAEAREFHGAGSLATATDPGGAEFSVWQPARHIGFEVGHQDNSVCWFELVTHDTESCAAFYGDVFGWTTSKDPANPPYTLFNRAGPDSKNGPVAGMMQIQPEWGEVSPHWLVYFQIPDIDAAVGRVLELGGIALHDVLSFAYGRLVAVQDPQRGIFGLMEMN